MAPIRVLVDTACVVSSISVNGNVSTYSYSSDKLSTFSFNFSNGKVTTSFEYDSQGRVIRTTTNGTLNNSTISSGYWTDYAMDSIGRLIYLKSSSEYNNLLDSTIFSKTGSVYKSMMYSVSLNSILYLRQKNEYTFDGENLQKKVEVRYNSIGKVMDSTITVYSGYEATINPFYKIFRQYGYPELRFYRGIARENYTSSFSNKFVYSTASGFIMTSLNTNVINSYNRSGSLSEVRDQTTNTSIYYGYLNCD